MEQSEIDELLGKPAEIALSALDDAERTYQVAYNALIKARYARDEAILECQAAQAWPAVIAEVLGTNTQRVREIANAHKLAKYEGRVVKPRRIED